MRSEPTALTEELRMIDMKLKTLKRDYEQYFLGSRPREPANLRAELQKTMIRLSSGLIKNTGDRFRFSTLNSQFLTFKRHWDETLRKMESGTYQRHIFKANLHDRERGIAQAPPPAARSGPAAKESRGSGDIFESYVKAAKSCGQNIAGLTSAKLQAIIEKQASAIKKQLGAKHVKFRVEVVDGKVKLKASATKAS